MELGQLHQKQDNMGAQTPPPSKRWQTSLDGSTMENCGLALRKLDNRDKESEITFLSIVMPSTVLVAIFVHLPTTTADLSTIFFESYHMKLYWHSA